MNFDFGTGADRNYNLASFGLVIGSFFVCIITLLILLLGGGGNETALPTQVSIPTSTITPTPTITRTSLPATFTPTFTPTGTAPPTTTLQPTATTSATFSPTPTITTTALPSNTPTETLTPVPTLSTPNASPSPFLFLPVTDPQLTTELNGICTWQGIGGQVLNVAGNDASTINVQIVVTGGGINQLTTENNTNTLYGPGGYEIQIDTNLSAQNYFVQLQSSIGTPLSPQIVVTFPGTCEGNLALINFQQTRDL